MSKAIERARKEIEKWTVKANQLAAEIKDIEQKAASIQEALGDDVLEGKDYNRSLGEISRLEASLGALKAGYDRALEKVEAGERSLEEAELEDAHNQAETLKKQADRAFEEVKSLLDQLETKSREIAATTAIVDGLKRQFQISISYPYDSRYWYVFANQIKGVADDQDRIGPGIGYLR